VEAEDPAVDVDAEIDIPETDLEAVETSDEA
jgi:hypothetical protein